MLNIELRGLDALERLDDGVMQAVDAALDRSAEVVSQAKARQIQKTYSRAIPTSSTGRPKWKRSGDWMQGQTTQRGNGTRTITTTGNATKYEARLANLPNGADGVNRTNKAAEEAARITEPQVGVVFEQELQNRLGR